jgi:hypothetical protein
VKIAKPLLLSALCLLAGYGFVRFFLSQLGGSQPGSAGPAGVLAGPPPGFEVVERGTIPPQQAAAELAALLDARPGPRRVGIRFERPGAAVYWLADSGADTLEEQAAGASGTRVQTVWSGHLRDRLRWARTHGDPAAPGLPEPERRNLYH